MGLESRMKKWFGIITMLVLVFFDQCTKYIAKASLEGKNAIELMKGVLEFQYLEGGNTGAAFGIFSGKTVFLGVVSLIVSIILLCVYFHIAKKAEYKWISWCIIFMCAGALGNCIDRLVNHYVIDFIYFKCIDFPIFNVADCYVTLSAIALFLLIAFSKETENGGKVNG
jgi:signal peptidase II